MGSQCALKACWQVKPSEKTNLLNDPCINALIKFALHSTRQDAASKEKALNVTSAEGKRKHPPRETQRLQYGL